MTKVRIGGDELTIHEFNGRKALRAAKIVRSVSDAWPALLTAQASFRRQYEQENVSTYDRAEALMVFGPAPLLNPETGEPWMVDGELVMAPGRLDHLSDEDWEKSGNVLRRPKSPSRNETIAAVLPVAFDMAEEQVCQLLALATIDGEDLGKAAREGGSEAIDAVLQAEAERLLDKGSLKELVILFVAAADQVEKELREALDEVGERAGNVLRLLGLAGRQEAETPTSPPKEPSSTPSPEPTDGARSEPSTAPAGGSSSSSSAD